MVTQSKKNARNMEIMAERKADLEESIASKTASLAGLEKRLRFLGRDNVRKKEEMKSIEVEMEDLTEKHLESVELLEVEKEAVFKGWEWEAEVLKGEVGRLERRVEMMDEREEENDRLRDERDEVMGAFAKGELEHEERMRDTKKKILELEEELSKAFKKELVVMDAKYQREAYESLEVKSKKALLENAKLSEEIVMQKIGLVNLRERMIIDDKHISSISTQEKELQDRHLQYAKRVAVLRRAREAYEARMADMDVSVQKLMEDEELWTMKLSQYPMSLEDVIEETVRLREEELINNSMLGKWKSRFIQIHNLVQAEKKRKQAALDQLTSSTPLPDYPGQSSDKDWTETLTTNMKVSQGVDTGDFQRVWAKQMQIWAKEDEVEERELESRAESAHSRTQSRAQSRAQSRSRRHIMTPAATPNAGRSLSRSMSSSILFKRKNLKSKEKILANSESVPHLQQQTVNANKKHSKSVPSLKLQPQDFSASVRGESEENTNASGFGLFGSTDNDSSANNKNSSNANDNINDPLDDLPSTPSSPPAIEQLLNRQPKFRSILDRDYEFMAKIAEDRKNAKMLAEKMRELVEGGGDISEIMALEERGLDALNDDKTVSTENNSVGSPTSKGGADDATAEVDTVANWLESIKGRPRLEIKRTTGMTRSPLPPMGKSQLAPVKKADGSLKRELGAAPRKRLCGALSDYRNSRFERNTVADRRAKKNLLMERMNKHKRRLNA